MRIGLDIDDDIEIVPGRLDLAVPATEMADAIRSAMQFRLDLQSRRDAIADARRGVDNARNAMLGDLQLNASVTLPTDSDRDRGGVEFDTGETEWEVGMSYDLPLDRQIERYGVRQAEISLARAERSFSAFRDDVAISVRSAVRRIDAALFSLEIQQRNVESAEHRQRAIEADPDRANVRQKTDAINQLSRARDALESARRDVDLAILEYLLTTRSAAGGRCGIAASARRADRRRAGGD